MRGHVDKLENLAKVTRVPAMLGVDFTPLHRVVLQFDTLVFTDGREIPIDTVVTGSAERVRLRVADGSKQNGVAAQARDEIAQKVKRTREEITQKAHDTIAPSQNRARWSEHFSVVDDLNAAPTLPPFRDVQAMAERGNPDLRAANEALRAAQQDVRTARHAFFPTILFDGVSGIEANEFALHSRIVSVWAQAADVVVNESNNTQRKDPFPRQR